MKILVNLKALGKRRGSVIPAELELENKPETVRELICETVKTCVSMYLERQAQRDVLRVMTQDDISTLAAGGKIAFSSVISGGKVDLNAAQENALLSFEDGIYCIFLGGKQLENLNDKIEISEQSELTFVRLTMLAGRLW